ncbi:hypothetical protein [Massilia sp. Mn16-1_5]|uniref:hypothetical protein n=1 Tax=Massilia sp. Mn16-1_5 TaxID=2079199 RepID=UPI00109EC977|nr:hypothetical protein [Massilia sp. Mn16-1_5]
MTISSGQIQNQCGGVANAAMTARYSASSVVGKKKPARPRLRAGLMGAGGTLFMTDELAIAQPRQSDLSTKNWYVKTKLAVKNPLSAFTQGVSRYEP